MQIMSSFSLIHSALNPSMGNSHPIQFKGEPQTTENPPATAPTSPSESSSKSWGQTIRDYGEGITDIFKKAMGFVDGAVEGFFVLKNVSAWNSVLTEVNPESTYYDRAMAILDITYAVFRENVHKTFSQKLNNSKESTSEFTPNAVNSGLYQSVLERFPGLLGIHSSLPGSVDIAKRALENFDDPTWTDATRKSRIEKLNKLTFQDIMPDLCAETLAELFS